MIALGVLFLLNNMYPGAFPFGKMWPVVLIIIGLSKVIEYFQAPQPQDIETKKETK